MWLLVFICTVTAVAALPVSQTLTAKSHATANVTLMLEPQWDSAETFEDLQENDYVQEGDILIPEDRNAVETLWPDASVAYATLGERASDILTAFKWISDATCIRFVEHTTEVNYLKFMNGKGCASYVGCRGGAQSVFFNSACTVGNLCHEIIHALGLHHEHTRKDRDKHVTVQWDSILPGKKSNFKVKSGNTQNLPYDVESIMHYGANFFSNDGSPTLVAKQSGQNMGQRTHLSNLDSKRLNKLYHCDKRMK
ncbi:zinc metalloproteinase nas-14-like [Clinocottus analis]|uniref:zinc metalloproteinase nas-14-like n=1 Tax=Clinocottus analis TaxID=304258 RepID=UPI0035C17AC5